MPLLITDGTETHGESGDGWVVANGPTLEEEPIGLAVENAVPVIPAATEAVDEAKPVLMIQPWTESITHLLFASRAPHSGTGGDVSGPTKAVFRQSREIFLYPAFPIWQCARKAPEAGRRGS